MVGGGGEGWGLDERKEENEHTCTKSSGRKKLITRLLESSIKRFLEKSPKIYQMTMELVQILKIFLG